MGLGPDSYAIIEQGRIGQILNSKPMDRRAIIEEAAGITMYKTKKRLAEAKLESSKLNLSRVNDILVEVEKQLASLKRQASKARRYAELREQMRGLLRQVLASKARELDAEAERLGEAAAGTGRRREQRDASRFTNLKREQERLSARTYELDAELRQTQNLLGQTALELDRAENRIAFNRRASGADRCARGSSQRRGNRASGAAGARARIARMTAQSEACADAARTDARLEAVLAGIGGARFGGRRGRAAGKLEARIENCGASPHAWAKNGRASRRRRCKRKKPLAHHAGG